MRGIRQAGREPVPCLRERAVSVGRGEKKEKVEGFIEGTDGGTPQPPSPLLLPAFSRHLHWSARYQTHQTLEAAGEFGIV